VVTLAEMRGRSFPAQVARTSGAIDTATRTMQVEVMLPNHDGALLPGAFVNVDLAAAPSGVLTVPANALLFRGEGVLVARVDDRGTVQLAPVHLGRNYGDSVEVLQGLSGNERLVLNPSDSIAAGDKVQVVADAKPVTGSKGAP
jgi:multidrug efflux pump subunit AcrA (membrane-fusion protein)